MKPVILCLTFVLCLSPARALDPTLPGLSLQGETLQALSKYGSQILDVSLAVRMETDPVFQKKAAIILLDQIIRYGDAVQAGHVINLLTFAPPVELESAVRQRLELSSVLPIKVLSIPSWEYLATFGDTESITRLVEVIETGSAEEVRQAARYFRRCNWLALRASYADKEKLDLWRRTLKALDDGIVKFADDRGTVACLMAGRYTAGAMDWEYACDKMLDVANRASGPDRLRALLEQSLSADKKPYVPPQITGYKEFIDANWRASMDGWRKQRLESLAGLGNYDERLLCAEAIAQIDAADSLMLDYGQSPDWSRRMSSAEYLMFTRNISESTSRVFTERNSMVLLSLLCVFVQS